jgi:hypothetical protein
MIHGFLHYEKNTDWRAPGTLYEPKGEEITGRWTKLYNKNFIIFTCNQML